MRRFRGPHARRSKSEEAKARQRTPKKSSEKREKVNPSSWTTLELLEFLRNVPGTQRIYVKTYGCSHNQSDSEFMMG